MESNRTVRDLITRVFLPPSNSYRQSYCLRCYGCVITRDRLTTISANIDGGQPWRQTFGHDNLVYTDWHKDNFYVAVKQLVGNTTRLGVEFDHLTVQHRTKLEQALPGCELIDISNLAMQIRIRKSIEELDLIREGARICDIGGMCT